MNARKSFFAVAILCAMIPHLTGCADKPYRETAHGVVVKAADGITQVRLEPITPTIIRVSATQESRFSNKGSLMACYTYPQRCWTTSSNGKEVTLKTSALQAIVSKETGKVRFTDLEGHEILSEDKRTFEQLTIDGNYGYKPDKDMDTGWTIRQLWNSPEDEAIYGLGQHQSDEFDWKGRNEELFQYNTKVTIPFMVSTKNYGILWDNYSLSRWGDARPYSHINEVFKLYDKNGDEGGLTGTYKPAKGGTLVRTEQVLGFENEQANKLLYPKDFQFKGSNVVYEGFLEAPTEGTYSFRLYYAGYMKAFIGNEEVMPERWRTAWNPNTYKFSYTFKKGERTPIRIEWQPDGGTSYCGLRALSPRPQEEENTISFWSEFGRQIDYYFVKGDNMDEVIGGYRTITGKAHVMPRWAMGYWQCRERYKTQDEVLGTVEDFRKRGMPLDNIVQDWFFWKEDQWGSFEFDPERYPDPKGMIDSLHRRNVHLMISCWPKYYANTEHFKEMDKHGWIYRQAIQDSIRDWVGKGYVGSFYDCFSAPARKLFWHQVDEHLFSLGMDAWWVDASEPDIRDCLDMPYWKAMFNPTAMGTSTEYLNAYGLMNAKGFYEGQRSSAPNKRVFLLTRSSFAGMQRYSTAVWSGDIASRWEDMKAQIPAAINFSMAGVPYWTMDDGGFCVQDKHVKAYKKYLKTGIADDDFQDWQEMNARWFQFGSFCPISRSHGQYPPREFYNVAPESHPAYQTIVAYNKLRYRLMPYIYSLAGAAYTQDYTIMRGLVMDYPNDHNVRHIGDQFLLGPSLMVAPVYTPKATTRTMYFPEDEGWYDILTGQFQQGGVTATVPAPYDKIPVYAPAGGILLYGPDIQWTDEKPADDITVYVYAGKDGSFTLYEDDGTNYDYMEKGAYSTIAFSYDDTARTLTIGDRHGHFDGMLESRTFRIVLIDVDHPQGLGDNQGAISTDYSGEAVKIKL